MLAGTCVSYSLEQTLHIQYMRTLNYTDSRKEKSKVAFDSEKSLDVLMRSWGLWCVLLFFWVAWWEVSALFRCTMIRAVQRCYLLCFKCETGAVYGPLGFILASQGAVWHKVTDNKEGVNQSSLLVVVNDSVCVCACDEITLGITLHWFSSQDWSVVKLPLCF